MCCFFRIGDGKTISLAKEEEQAKQDTNNFLYSVDQMKYWIYNILGIEYGEQDCSDQGGKQAQANTNNRRRNLEVEKKKKNEIKIAQKWLVFKFCVLFK